MLRGSTIRFQDCFYGILRIMKLGVMMTFRSDFEQVSCSLPKEGCIVGRILAFPLLLELFLFGRPSAKSLSLDIVEASKVALKLLLVRFDSCPRNLTEEGMGIKLLL